jgi:hypothetical protein
MASSRINFIRGTACTFEINIVDEDGEPLELSELEDATAEFFLRTSSTSNVDVLHFTTSANPTRLKFKTNEAVLALTFTGPDTSALTLATYAYKVLLVLADGRAPNIIEWSPFDLSLGGVSEVTPPVFDNTVKVDHDYDLTDSLRYMTLGGTPIGDAQIRLYLKSDYDARHLDHPVGVTVTNAFGRWRDPILVTPGFSYVVLFTKPNEFGPDVATITA